MIKVWTVVPGTPPRSYQLEMDPLHREGGIDLSSAPVHRGWGHRVGVVAPPGRTEPLGVDSLDGEPPSTSGGSFLDTTNHHVGSLKGAIAMNTGGWISLGRLFPGTSTRERRPRTHAQRSRRTIPSLESLEAIALLSTGSAVVRLHDLGHHLLATKHMSPGGSSSSDMDATSTSVTLPAQTLSLGSTLTNFTNLPLSPALNLFDPSLGTLISVAVSHSATLQGNVTSTNLSPSPALITASLSGSYSIDGLNEPISQPTRTVSGQPVLAGVFGSSNDTVTFPPLFLTDSSSMTFTDPTSLAFFTASSGRATITPAMTATGSASAEAPNGNLSTIAVTSASATTVTVSYTYLPTTPPPTPMCPTPVSIGRIGLHHQKTLLILTFSGSVNPTLAEDTSNYSVITRGGRRIAIVSATFNPTTNSVTLQPARRLNVHLHFQLSVKLPCPNAESAAPVLIPFGGRSSLIGFHNHRGQFVPV